MDYHRLGLGNASSLIHALRISDWGASVLFDCIYDPLGERKEYQLSFRGCSRLQVEMLPGAPLSEPQADLIGITLGQPEGRKPAVVTTDLFEVQITYREFHCIKAGHAVALDELLHGVTDENSHG